MYFLTVSGKTIEFINNTGFYVLHCVSFIELKWNIIRKWQSSPWVLHNLWDEFSSLMPSELFFSPLLYSYKQQGCV